MVDEEEDFDSEEDEEDFEEDELEDIVEDSSFVIPWRSSGFVIPSLERQRIVESLERGVRRVVDEDTEEVSSGEYGPLRDYMDVKDYESSEGGGSYESSVSIDVGSSSGGLPMSSAGSGMNNPTQGSGGYPGRGSKREGKRYHSPLEQGSMDEERKKREKERKMW